MKRLRQFGCEYLGAGIRKRAMQKKALILFVFALFCLGTVDLFAKGTMFKSGPLVDHPVSHPAATRYSGKWRTSVGAWGESFADQTLRLRGFKEIHEIKHGANNGIDRIAVMREPSGKIKDVRFVEVKTSRSSKPNLRETQYGGKQMSRRWLAANLRIMRNSGDPAAQKLALEVSRFRKTAARPIESMGEVMHVNTKTGKLTGYAVDGRTIRYGQSIERLLENIQARAGSKSARDWATRTLAQLDQIKVSSMSDYLGKTPKQQSTRSLVSNSRQNVRAASVARSAVLRQSRSEALSVIVRRSAGRIALFVGVAFDAKELFDTEFAYRRGAISLRQRNIQLASSAGGMSGAFAGGATGAAIGAAIGVEFFGIGALPGSIIGGFIGGLGGYYGGSAVGAYGATAWYNSIDASVRDKFEVSWLDGNGITK